LRPRYFDAAVHDASIHEPQYHDATI